MGTHTIRKLAAASILAFAASASHAAMENAWTYNLTLNWLPGTAVFNNVDANGRPTNSQGGYYADQYLLSWGALNGNYMNPTADPGNNRSGLVIDNSPATGTIDTNGASVSANMFTHYNAPIWSNLPDLNKVQMAVSVTLTSLDGSAMFKLDRTFEVFFKETVNDGQQCAWGLCDDDIFAIVSIDPKLNDLSSSFTLDGWEYTFNYFETSSHLKPLASAACEAAGIAAGRACYGFTTPESMNTLVQFGFSVTAVPEPQTYAMLLAGLGMIGVVARRRRNALQ